MKQKTLYNAEVALECCCVCCSFYGCLETRKCYLIKLLHKRQEELLTCFTNVTNIVVLVLKYQTSIRRNL